MGFSSKEDGDIILMFDNTIEDISHKLVRGVPVMILNPEWEKLVNSGEIPNEVAKDRIAQEKEKLRIKVQYS